MRITRNTRRTLRGPSERSPGPSTSTTPDRLMTHLAMLEVDDDGTPATWGDHVSGEEYGAAPPSDG